MTRFIVSMLMVAGIVASPAQAGGAKGATPGEPKDVRLELPAETLAAFEQIAAAGEARRAGEDAASTDARLSEGLRRLARSVTLLGSDGELAAFALVELAVVGPEVSARIGRASGEADELALALDGLGAAKLDWLERHAASGEPEGPRTRCFMNLVNCMRYCAGMDSAIMRAACGLDCETDFVSCMPIRLPGLPGAIGEIIRRSGGLFN